MSEQTKTLESINPLIIGDGWSDDAAHNIRCAIEFLADAVPYVMNTGHSNETSHGAHILLRACAAALEICHD